MDHRAVPLPATYSFPSVQSYNDAVSGVNPKGYTTFAQTIGEPNFDMRNALFSTFIQDDLKLTSDFKLLYGVRYDYYMYPGGIDGSPYSVVQPRQEQHRAARRLRVDARRRPPHGAAWQQGLMYDQPLLAIIENAYAARASSTRARASR